MSTISDLAKTFETNSKAQAARIEQDVRSAFDQHEACLRQALSESAARMSADIDAQHARMRRLLLRSWKLATIVLIATLLACGSAIWGMGLYVQSQYREMSANQAALETLANQGGKLQFSRCGEKKRTCIEVDSSAGTFGERGHAYMIPKGY